MTINWHDRPWMTAVAAAVFLGMGVLFMVIGMQAAWQDTVLWPAAAAIGVGLCGLMIGGYAVRQSGHSSVVIDRDRGVFRLDRRLLWWRRSDAWPFAAIAMIDVETWDGVDGPAYRPWLVLKSGERVPLTATWHRKSASSYRLQVAVDDALRQAHRGS